jgi:hypothetical protein
MQRRELIEIISGHGMVRSNHRHAPVTYVIRRFQDFFDSTPLRTDVTGALQLLKGNLAPELAERKPIDLHLQDGRHVRVTIEELDGRFSAVDFSNA